MTQRTLEHPTFGTITIMLSGDDELTLAELEHEQSLHAGASHRRHTSGSSPRQPWRIASGRVADVFSWDEAHVLKLFRAGYPACAIQTEARACRLARAAGLAVPRPRYLADVQGRHGLVCERIDGPSMMAHLARRPLQLRRQACRLAHVHATVHRCSVEGLPTQAEQLAALIGEADVDSVIRRRALAALRSLAQGSALCHGDFHPDNVLLAGRQSVIIDWTTACTGDPLGDVAITALILELGRLPEELSAGARALAALGRRLFRAAYLRRYRTLTGISRRELDRWTLPVAVARLARRLPSEQRALARLIDTCVSTPSSSRTLRPRGVEVKS